MKGMERAFERERPMVDFPLQARRSYERRAQWSMHCLLTMMPDP